MALEPLLTLRDLARELRLPESTVRFYRNLFDRFLPSVGDGRRRRYQPEALGLLRFIAESFAQNRRREDIEAVLAEMTGIDPTAPVPEPVHAPLPVARRPMPAAPDEMVSTLLEGERDRREVMWQIAKEIVRLGEAVERQHLILESMARRLDQQAGHLLPPVEAQVAPAAPAAEAAADTSQALATELERLRGELAEERELVERLRKAKLAVERRAAEAENRSAND